MYLSCIFHVHILNFKDGKVMIIIVFNIIPLFSKYILAHIYVERWRNEYLSES